MNTSTPHPNVSVSNMVQELSDEKARLLAPAIVYISLLMVSGIIGNILVWIFYGIVTKVSTNTFFIIVLATYDLLACFISMPTEIADIRNYYTFESGFACKSLRFINYVCAIGSGLTLMAIAVDRYKRIYKPTDSHWTIKKAKIICIILMAVAIFLAWPSIVFYDTHEIPLGRHGEFQLVGRDCTTTTKKDYNMYLLIFNAIHFLIFIVCSTSVCVMYAIIGATIYRHRKTLSNYSHGSSKSEYSGNITESLTQETNLEQDHSQNNPSSQSKPEDAHDNIASHADSTTHTVNTSGSGDNHLTDVFEDDDVTAKKTGFSLTKIISQQFKSRQPIKVKKIDNETVKITLVMIAVTGLFLLSFLPYLSLIIWRSIIGEHEESRIAGSNLVIYEIGIRSFLLNSGLNPWIYGIFNSNFRQYFYKKCFVCRQ